MIEVDRSRRDKDVSYMLDNRMRVYVLCADCILADVDKLKWEHCLNKVQPHGLSQCLCERKKIRQTDSHRTRSKPILLQQISYRICSLLKVETH